MRNIIYRTTVANLMATTGLVLLSTTVLAGCGGAAPQTKKADFTTSGSREADQRADQRMARDQQIKGTGGTAADSSKATSEATGKKTLYERLGRTEGLQAIIEDFTARALADPRVNWQREGIKRGGFSIHTNESMTWSPTAENVQTLKVHLIEFLAVATGGPARYGGRPMKEVHSGMHISNPEFDASVGDLKATLDKLKVADKEQKELIAVIESTRPEIAEER